MKDACRDGVQPGLSEHLVGSPGAYPPAPKEKLAREQRLRASIEGYQGRLSRNDFIVNLGATFE